MRFRRKSLGSLVTLAGLIATLVTLALPSPTRAAASTPAPSDLNLTQFVNPFIGTGQGAPDYGFGNEGGHVFPGAGYPEGMVQFSPDTTSAAGGYRYDQTVIHGLSLTHFSGRGCAAYQDFPFMPTIGPIASSPGTNWNAYSSAYSHASETASPGYYAVRLDTTGIGVRLTVTPRTGMGEFTFPASPDAALLVNAGGSATGDSAAGTMMHIDGSDTIVGKATSGGFCGSQSAYTIYMAARFARSFASAGTWNGATVTPGSQSSAGAQSGAYVTFDTTHNAVVRVKVGISFVSVGNALANLDAENPGWNFDAVRAQADAAWNARLNRIQVQGGTADERVIFYTALYHTLFHPNIFSDANGQYIGFDGQVYVAQGYTQYENISGWDMYRSLLPLLAVLDPQATSDMMQSLVADAQQGGGGLPKWEVANDNSGGMVGDSGDILVATAYAFGARQFDTSAALKAMTLAATNPQARSGRYVVRPGLSEYVGKGYIPLDTPGVTGPVATTLEYSADDFAISRFAAALGDSSAANTFFCRSDTWRNLYDPATGYLTPRLSSGAFVASYDPTSENGYVEGDGAQYTWLVPYNLAGLFDAMGGNTQAVARLDEHFAELNAGPTSPYALMGNEPEFGNPWEYDFAGAPAHTQAVVRRIELQLFHNAPGGLVGNDDGGAMASWYVWAALGMYPEIPGVAGFALGSPLFSSVALSLGNGHLLRLTAPAASDTAPYVQSLTLNGQPYASAWLPWSAIAGGATLDYTLGSAPNPAWGSAPAVAPPSFDGGGACLLLADVSAAPNHAAAIFEIALGLLLVATALVVGAILVAERLRRQSTLARG